MRIMDALYIKRGIFYIDIKKFCFNEKFIKFLYVKNIKPKLKLNKH